MELFTPPMADHTESPPEESRGSKPGHGRGEGREEGSGRQSGTAPERRSAEEPRVATVLLVDDNEEIRSAISEILEDEGYTVATAVNGKEALEALTQRPLPRLILLDLMMPVMDGWQFLAVRRSDPLLSQVPVVILSAFAHSADRVAGVTAILSKPVDPNLLIKLVRSHVGDPDA